MKRIAFVTAAALLGTACVSSSSPPPPYQGPTGTVNLTWSFWRDAPGQVSGSLEYDTSRAGAANGPCDQSKVDYVTVDSPVGSVTVDCVHTNGVQGISIPGVPEGVQSFTFRAYRGATLLYSSTENLEVMSAMPMDYWVRIPGVWAPVELDAYLGYGTATPPYYAYYASCAAAGNPSLDFEVRDIYGLLVDYNPSALACNEPLPAVLDTLGLDLDDFWVRVRGYDLLDNLMSDSCWVQLQHFGTETGVNAFAPVVLRSPLPTCQNVFVQEPAQ